MRCLLLCCFGAAGVPGAVGPGRPRDRHTRARRLGVVDLEARPGPAAAHGHRSQAPRLGALPCPPAPFTPATPCRCACLGASSRSPVRPCRRPPATRPGSAVPPAPSGNAAWPCWPCCQFHFTPGRALSLLSPHSMSHAIPSQLFQTMNLDCWNCTVFRCC